MTRQDRNTSHCMLEARSVTYRLNGRQLLADVSVRVRLGIVHVLVGPNGAGKTTLMRLLAGELTPSSGTVYLDGRPLPSYSSEELAQRRAVLPQQTVLQFFFRAREVVWMGRYPYLRERRWAPEEHWEAVVEAMRVTETAYLADQPYPLLSGGERTRIDLARVLAQRTPVLLLDEPSASLDLRHQMLLLTIMRRLADAGAAVLAIVHDLNLAATADEVWLIDRGQLVAAGPPHTVLTPQALEQVYGWPVSVLRRPDSERPLVVPHLPGEVAQSGVHPRGSPLYREERTWTGYDSSSTA